MRHQLQKHSSVITHGYVEGASPLSDNTHPRLTKMAISKIFCVFQSYSTTPTIANALFKKPRVAKLVFSRGISEPVFRRATARDAAATTRRAIQEGWHVGPYDFPTYVAFDSNSYQIGEIDGEIACHVGTIEFPNHHAHGGGIIVSEKYQKQGLGTRCTLKGMSICDPNITIGTDINSDSEGMFNSLGFTKHWDTYVVMLDLEKITKSNPRSDVGVSVKSIPSVNLNKLLQYDAKIFGTPRYNLMKMWYNTPGSFGWAAVDDQDTIKGYAVVKQVIRGGGTEIGLAMAPLFADNKEIAKLLLKSAADECLANRAVPKTELELFHPVGDNCGEDAAELMEELEAELTHIALRVYTKGAPPGRQNKNIYGITSPSCD